MEIFSIFRGELNLIHGYPPQCLKATGAVIWINTPLGPQRLLWDGVGFVGDSLTISIVGGEWCISGDVDYCFGDDETFVCKQFPDGYSFNRASGPVLLAEIIIFDEQQDHLGRVSHYRLMVERLDQKGVYIQE